MLARRVLTAGGRRLNLQANNLYLESRGWLIEAIPQADGYLKFSEPLESEGTSLFRPNGFGYVSADEIGAIGTTSASGVTRLGRQFHRADFDWRVPFRVFPRPGSYASQIPNGFAMMRDRLVSLYSSGKLLTSSDVSGTINGAFDLTGTKWSTSNVGQTDGRNLYLVAGGSLNIGPDLTYNNLHPESSLSSLWLDYRDTINNVDDTAALLRVRSSDFSASEILLPTDEMETFVPNGAETIPVWGRRLSFNVRIAWAKEDELYLVANGDSHKVWRGTLQSSSGTTETWDMAFSTRRFINLYKLDKNGVVTFVNTLWQRSRLYGYGNYTISETSTPGVRRVNIRSGFEVPATGTGADPTDFGMWGIGFFPADFAQMGDLAYFRISSSGSINGTGGTLFRLQIDVQRSVVRVASLSPGVTNLTSFEKHGVLMTRDNNNGNIRQSKNGGVAWVESTAAASGMDHGNYGNHIPL